MVPTFDVEAESITIFAVGDEYIFSHYFEREDLFDALSPYYVSDAYRFEVPAAEFEDVTAVLEDAHLEPVVVEDLEPYCVVTERYEPHADILRNAVLTWERRGHRFFLLPDELSVRQAVENGARRLAETEFVVGL